MSPSQIASPRRVLPEGRFAGAMPWVIAIMMFFAVLAAAGGLAIGSATQAVEGAISGRITVQIIEANPDVKAQQRAGISRSLRAISYVDSVTDIGDEEVRRLLKPWLGSEGLDDEVPVPVLIDASLADVSPGAIKEVERVVKAIAPNARVDRHSDWLGPLGGLLTTLQWLALVLVALTGAAAGATVVLGARAAMDHHRATIDVMHLMGATDRQISQLFERRVAQDAVSGAALGFVVAIGVLLIVGWRIDAVGAALFAGGTLTLLDWALLALIPLGGVGLAILSARLTVLHALARIL